MAVYFYFCLLDYNNKKDKNCISCKREGMLLSGVTIATLGEGTQIWFGQGVPLEPKNSYPSLRVILAEKGIHC